jgi:DNA-binding XRE family transcriptional regulator
MKTLNEVKDEVRARLSLSRQRARGVDPRITGPLVCTLRALRRQHGLSQQDVANAVGISVPCLSFIERGRAPRERTALKLMKFFEEPLDRLWPELQNDRSIATISPARNHRAEV